MLAYLFLVFAVAVHARFLPLPFSFAPVTAALLYFGARRPRQEMWVPVAALAAAGMYLSRSVYGYAFSADLLVTWAWYAGMVLLGGLLAKNASALRVGAASLAGFGVVLPAQQLRGVGGLEHVSQDRQRLGDVLRCRVCRSSATRWCPTCSSRRRSSGSDTW